MSSPDGYNDTSLHLKIDMTPPNVLAETIKQVVKILKSPGCRKTPVFVKSLETAVEVSQVFARNGKPMWIAFYH